MPAAVRHGQAPERPVGAHDEHTPVAGRAALEVVGVPELRLIEADGAPSTIYLHFACLISRRRHAQPWPVGYSIARIVQPHL
jgi:hypothetical protein